jgi:hypothetical protein
MACEAPWLAGWVMRAEYLLSDMELPLGEKANRVFYAPPRESGMGEAGVRLRELHVSMCQQHHNPPR